MAEHSSTNVWAAYEILLEELETEISRLNDTGGRAFRAGEHTRAKELLARVEQLTRVRSDLVTLGRTLRPLVDETGAAGNTLLIFTSDNGAHWTPEDKARFEHRANAEKPNMGLTSWKGAGVRKADVTVAKNYLAQEEIGELNRIVTMWLDFAEDQARRRKQVFLRDEAQPFFAV